MSSNNFYHHYKKQLDIFGKHLSLLRKRKEVEDIHQLRVATKKLRAHLTLMEIASWGKFRKQKHFKYLLKLFKSAGILREIQVHQMIIEALDLETHYADELCQSAIHFYRADLAQQAQKAHLHLDRELRAFNTRKFKKLDRKVKEIVSGLADELFVDESKSFSDRQIEKINKLRVHAEYDRNLHKIRKHLKLMSANMRLSNELLPDESVKNRIKHLKIIEDLIGEWHDYMELGLSMENYLQSSGGAQYHEVLKNVMSDLALRAEHLKIETVAALQEHLEVQTSSRQE